MKLFKAISSFFKKLVSRTSNFISELWQLAKPFLQEVLSDTSAAIIKSLQELALQAVQYVAAQGLPNDESKRKAFAEYMVKATKAQGIILRDYELNLLREMAYSILKTGKIST